MVMLLHHVSSVSAVAHSTAQHSMTFKSVLSVCARTTERDNSVTKIFTESMTDLVMTPVTHPLSQIKVDTGLFHGTYDHYAVVFTLDMEYVINELIIPEVKVEGEISKMAKAVNKQFEENFGGSWTVFISKNFPGGWAGIPQTGIFIEFEHEDCHFVIFRK